MSSGQTLKGSYGLLFHTIVVISLCSLLQIDIVIRTQRHSFVQQLQCQSIVLHHCIQHRLIEISLSGSRVDSHTMLEQIERSIITLHVLHSDSFQEEIVIPTLIVQ